MARPADGTFLPDVTQYCNVLKTHTSGQARRYSEIFFGAAMIVIATHIGATLLATMALVGHRNWPPLVVGGLLFIESIVLLFGFGCHRWIHHHRLTKLWAISRLLAEINRSVRSLENLGSGYLFRLRLPAELIPLLRTINICIYGRFASLVTHPGRTFAINTYGTGWRTRARRRARSLIMDIIVTLRRGG